MYVLMLNMFRLPANLLDEGEGDGNAEEKSPESFFFNNGVD